MDWCTPKTFFEELNAIHGFTLDAAASHTNAKCLCRFTKDEDGLEQDWGGHTVWLNPPYGREIGKWVKKAYEESCKPNTKVVMLIPSRTDTSYWHDYILPYGKIEFLRGRLRFEYEDGTPADPAPFPSAVVVFGEEAAHGTEKD